MPTIGRVAELAAIDEVVASTAAGLGRVLLLEGEAGIGKTHLVREAMARADRSGFTVVGVVADELVRRPGVIPHGIWAAATKIGDESSAFLGGLLDSTRAASESVEDRRYAIIEATVDLVESLAQPGPLLLAVDDLQWADDLSIGTLAAIISRVDVSRWGVVGALRPTRSSALDRLIERVRDGPGIHRRVGPLPDEDVDALATSLVDAVPSERLRQRLRATAGNPLFITELVGCLGEEGLVHLDGGVADVAGDVITADLQETVVRRLSWLPSATLELLRQATLLGTSFTLRDLAAITGRTIVETAAALRPASLAGLVSGDADGLSFRHDLVREALYGHMPPAERRDLHHAAASALAKAGGSTQQIAQQHARGATPGDLEAIGWLERAALEALPISPGTAVDLLGAAITLAPLPWDGTQALEARLIDPLTLCGRYDDAEAIATAVLATTTDPAIEYGALRGLRSVHSSRGDMGAQIAALQRAAAADGAPAREATRLHCYAAQLSVLTGALDVETARRATEEALAAAIADHDTMTESVARQALGLIHAVTGYGDESRRQLSKAVALFDPALVTTGVYITPDNLLALELLELDAVEEAIVAADRARERGERLGARSRLPLSYLALAAAHLRSGSWDDAKAALDTGLAIIHDSGAQNFLSYYAAVLATIAIHRDELDDAELVLGAELNRRRGGPPQLGAEVLAAAHAELLAARGQHDPAVAVAEAAWTRSAHVRYFYGYRARGVSLVREAIRVGRHDLAEAVTSELEEGARRCPVASADATALLCRALLLRDGDLGLAATGRYRQTRLRPDLAACCLDTADLLIAKRRRDEAIALLHEAAAIHAETGANADAAQVETRLRQLDASPRHARPARRPTFGWESLTPMEHRVIELVARGLTNPEIGARLYISRRTVETHLSHVFRKLGLPSRTALVAEATRRAATPPE